jgi:hypothetical protein
MAGDAIAPNGLNDFSIVNFVHAAHLEGLFIECSFRPDIVMICRFKSFYLSMGCAYPLPTNISAKLTLGTLRTPFGFRPPARLVQYSLVIQIIFWLWGAIFCCDSCQPLGQRDSNVQLQCYSKTSSRGANRQYLVVSVLCCFIVIIDLSADTVSDNSVIIIAAASLPTRLPFA